jgi:Flp pilus assembly protein TadG
MTRRKPARERGQALAETGIVIALFVSLVMGTIEFGRAWMIANMITHATRDGARMAAVTPATSRNSTGVISSTSAIQTQVLNEISNVMSSSGFTVNVTQPTLSGIPMVQVQVTGSVPYLFNLPGVGTSFSVSRTVTFRDEGR